MKDITIVYSLLLATTLTLGVAQGRHAFAPSLNNWRAHSLLRDSIESSLEVPLKADESCLRLLQNVTNYFLANNETVERILRNSGKDYNDLGRYEDCLNTTGFRYILATVPKALPIPMSVGLCVPEVCTVQDFNNFKSYLVQAANALIPELFAGVKGFDLQTQLNTDDLHFEESLKRNQEVTRADAWGWITVLFIVFFVFTTVLSSVAAWYFKKENDRRLAERREKIAQRQAAKAQRKKESASAVIAAEVDALLLNPSAQSDPETQSTSSSKKRKEGGGSKKRFKKQSSIERAVTCFSLQNSLSRLFMRRVKDPESDKELEALNGVRVIVLAFVILGNTYFYTLKGPLQNMNIIQEWMEGLLFGIVLTAEHAVDIFFWLTAFLGSYFLLAKLKDRDGLFPSGGVAMFYLNRLVRLLPLYMFAMFFFWKFLVLFGGDGPLFYQYQTTTECQKYWFWHLTFLNNIVPWSQHDTCLPWTWYLANDFQFFLLLPLLTQLYIRNRQRYYYTLLGLLGGNTVIQMAVILANSLSVSYFTYKDEYWTVYYVKPYSRLPVFLIGVVAGCSYFSFKKEEGAADEQRLPKIYQALQHSNGRAVISNTIGNVVMLLMGSVLQVINNSPNGVAEFTNMVFLLVHRPLFISGFTMMIMPVLVALPKTPCRPLLDLLSHPFWVPFSRLSYGAFLSHGIWMQFRDYNTERGTWGCGLDAFLFYLAYLTFSFLFSFITALIWEQPIASLWQEFVVRPGIEQSSKADAYYHSQSAKSVYRESKGEETTSVKDVIQAKKLKLEGKSSDEPGEELLVHRKSRRGSGDTVDLEESEQPSTSINGDGSKKLYSFKPK